MTCCGCKALNVKMTNNGLCTACKKRAARTGSSRMMRRAAARHWTEGENAVLLNRYQMKHIEAIERAVLLRRQLLKWFDAHTITLLGLDNPYAEDHARRTLVADAHRMQEAHDIGIGIGKPVQSERQIQLTRKQAA